MAASREAEKLCKEHKDDAPCTNQALQKQEQQKELRAQAGRDQTQQPRDAPNLDGLRDDDKNTSTWGAHSNKRAIAARRLQVL